MARGPSVPNLGGLKGLQDPVVDTEMHQLDPLQDGLAAQLWGEVSTQPPAISSLTVLSAFALCVFEVLLLGA